MEDRGSRDSELRVYPIIPGFRRPGVKTRGNARPYVGTGPFEFTRVGVMDRNTDILSQSLAFNGVISQHDMLLRKAIHLAEAHLKAITRASSWRRNDRAPA